MQVWSRNVPLKEADKREDAFCKTAPMLTPAPIRLPSDCEDQRLAAISINLPVVRVSLASRPEPPDLNPTNEQWIRRVRTGQSQDGRRMTGLYGYVELYIDTDSGRWRESNDQQESTQGRHSGTRGLCARVRLARLNVIG